MTYRPRNVECDRRYTLHIQIVSCEELLSKQLVMRAGSLEIGEALVRGPDEEPVSHVRDVALPMPRPCTGEGTHAVPAPQLLERPRRVLEHEVDDLVELMDVTVPFLWEALEVARERRGVFSLQHAHDASAASTSSRAVA